MNGVTESLCNFLGYSSLTEGAHTPMFGGGGGGGGTGSIGGPAPSVASTTVGVPASPAPIDDKLAPRCWRTVYLLLELYANMPDAETITHRFSVSTELPEQYRRSGRPASRDGAGGGPGAGVPATGRVVVVGAARVHRTRLLASLSGLRLEAELCGAAAQTSWSRARQWAASASLARSTLCVLEGAQQVVVRATAGKSQALHSWEAGRAGAAIASIGPVRVELPQHPVALHGVMTRSSRQLSSTLQELGVGRPQPPQPPQQQPAPPPPPPRRPPPPATAPPPVPAPQLQFSVVVTSLSVTAALLPSLQAQYKMEHVHGSGVTGPKAHFIVDLPQHSLSFVTKLQMTEANLPAAAMVALPAVSVRARVVEESPEAGGVGGGGAAPDGAVLRAGSYLAATADIGLFEHTLSTDLLNHLVFVQKVFMKVTTAPARCGLLNNRILSIPIL